jgi:copper chaperone CopZ
MFPKAIKFKSWLKKVISAIKRLKGLEQENSDLKVLVANVLIKQNQTNDRQIIENIQLAEFKVFSQCGDDGIIQFLISHLNIQQRTFIEFGVEDYTESNTRFLLINNNWTGLIMDGSENHINTIKKDNIYWHHQLTAVPVFITAENINPLIVENGFEGEIGLLHIDIDGNDYWIWKEITVISPIIVIVEYNSIFGVENTWSVPYKPDFDRTIAHHSNLYFGASLAALCDLAEEKGYYFIGSNSTGNNAYFVRKDKIQDIKPLDVKSGYVLSKFRESRDKNGDLTYISGADRLKTLEGMEVYNTRTKRLEKI